MGRLAALAGGKPGGGPVPGMMPGHGRVPTEHPAAVGPAPGAAPGAPPGVVSGPTPGGSGFVRRWGVPPRAALACLVLCLAVAAGLAARAVTTDRGVREWVPAAGEGDAAGVALPTGLPTGPATGPATGESAGTSAATGTAGPGTGAPTSPQVTPGAPGAVLVHVVGAVRRPGVVTLPAGARVLDAVTAAGGATRRAELAAVNLARPVVDGEQLWVPARGETVAPGGAASGGVAGGGSGTGGSGAGAPAAKVNLNTADAAALDTLPGVGPVLAGRILQWRTANGRFTSVDELAEVQGIGDRLLEGLRDLVTVS